MTQDQQTGQDATDLDARFHVHAPSDESKTCQVVVDTSLSPKMEMYENLASAEGQPLVQALLRIDGMHSVITKDRVLILARKDDVDWPPLLDQVRGVLQDGLDNAPAAAAPSPGAEASGSDDELLSREIRVRVQDVLDSEINPGIAAHGGLISIVDVQGTKLFLSMGGGCQGCASAAATLAEGVERAIRAQVPEVTEIMDSTDHAAGSNPYFQSY